MCKQAECDACIFSDWSPWSKCDRTCGLGTKVRFQMNVYAAKQCDISKSQIQDCNIHSCDSDTFGWSSWGACSNTCGGGSRNRYHFGDQELENNIETEICGVEKCPDEYYSNWSKWSPCSVTCGMTGGITTRHRDCLGNQCPSGALHDEKQCGALTLTCIEEQSTCPNGTVYTLCGKPCMHRCAESSSCLSIPRQTCKPGCFCPEPFIYDDILQKCVAPSECKCKSDQTGRTLEPGEGEMADCNRCRCASGQS